MPANLLKRMANIEVTFQNQCNSIEKEIEYPKVMDVLSGNDLAIVTFQQIFGVFEIDFDLPAEGLKAYQGFGIKSRTVLAHSRPFSLDKYMYFNPHYRCLMNTIRI